MKIQGYQRWGNALVVIFLAVSMLISTGAQTAQAQEPALPAEQTYLIPIPLPDLGKVDLPARLDRDQADSVTEGLLAKEAGRILDELRLLKERGLVSDYEIMPDAPVVRVTMTQDRVPEVARALPEGASALVEESEGLPACVSSAVDHLPDMVMAASRTQNQRDLASTSQATVLAAGAPVIEVYYYEEPGYRYAYVSGTATPKSEARLRVLRGGKQVALDYELVDEYGYYSFSRNYLSCTESYNWELQPGDVVEISAGGFTSSTTVTPIKGWADGDANTVSGITGPGRTVKVELYQIDRSAPCFWQSFIKTGSADAAGNFSINLGDQVNFDRSADVRIYSTDGAGNSTFYYAQNYRLKVYPDGYYYLYLKPQTSFTLVLKRGATILETVHGTTDPDWGGFSKNFTNTVQPGDQATVTFNGGQLGYTVVNWPSVSVNRDSGQVSGSAAPGMVLSAGVYNNTYNATLRCSYAGKCASQTVPSNGQFSVNIGVLFNGEEGYIDFYTPEGEGLYYSDFEPSIEAYPTYDEVDISWWWTDTLTVTLKDSANAFKESYTFDLSYWDSEFWVSFSTDMVPGDRIEVTDGSTTRTMTVGSLADLRANFNSDHVTGAVSAGHLLTTTWSDTFSGCAEKDHPGGAFDLTPGVDILGNSSARVELRGGDGYYTIGYAYALRLYPALNSSWVDGRTETPGAAVNWTHKRGGTVLDTGTMTSDSGGWFYFSSPPAFQADDVLVITTGDGNTATIIYPALTLETIAAESRVSGKAIANRIVQVYIIRNTTDYGFYNSRAGWTDSAANYSIHFPPDVWDIDCRPFDLNGSCQAKSVSARLENGFWVEKYDYLQAPEADIYEIDNAWQSAKSYAGPQAHSLHEYLDEDWVKFTVSAADAANGVPFHLITVNAGLFMDLNLELYTSSDLTTPIQTAWGEEDPWYGTHSPRLVYTFTQAGTYYLRIHSKGSDWDGGYCTSLYTFLILRDPKGVFLPLITR